MVEYGDPIIKSLSCTLRSDDMELLEAMAIFANLLHPVILPAEIEE